MKTLVSFLLVLLPLSAFHLVAEPVSPVAPKAPAAPVAPGAPAPVAPKIAPAPPVAPAAAPAPPSLIAAPAPKAPVAPKSATPPAAPEPPANRAEMAPPLAAPRPPEPPRSGSSALAPEAASTPGAPPREIDVPNPGPAPAPPQQSFALPVLSESDLASRPFRIVDRIETRACTLKLNRPRNSGDPTVNPAETLAITRLVKKADARGADAVANLKCFSQIAIGFGCPTSVGCQADAIAFEGS